MKRIANFTQTYRGNSNWSPGSDGKNRDFLIEALCKNSGKINSIQLLDYQTFNFHNLEVSHSKSLAQKIKTVLPDCNFFVYQNMSFGNTILKHLHLLKERGISDVLWIQDDEFFTHTNFNDFKILIDFYKKTPEIKHINLLNRLYGDTQINAYTQHKGVSPVDSIQVTNDIFIYKTYARDIEPANNYVMDFSAFICDIDFFLTKMYDETFINHLDAYKLEGAVNAKSLQNNVQRFFTNISFFESFNIVGMPPSLGNGSKALARLKEIVKKDA
jgi:hypothetical protein